MSTVIFGVSKAVATSGVPAEVPDGADVNVWLDTFGRAVGKSTDISTGTDQITDAAPALSQRAIVIFDQLTAPGSTPSINMHVYNKVLFQIVVASIDNSVDVRVEGSLDNSNWFNLDDAGTDVQYTGNGTFQIHKDNFSCEYIRFTFVSEVGGTNVTLDVDMILGN